MKRSAIRAAGLAAVLLLSASLTCDAWRALPARAAAVAPAPTARRVWVGRAQVLARTGDDSLVAPVRLATIGDSLYVLDAAHRAVFRLWWPTPRHAVLAPTPLRGGAGTYVASSVAGGLALLDHARGRIRTARGSAQRQIPIAHLASPFAMCLLPSGDAIVLTGGVDSALVRVTPQGSVVWARRWPWPAAAQRAGLARQGMFAPLPDGTGCVLASVFGDGWAVIDADGQAVRTAAYHLRVAEPVVMNRSGAERLSAGIPAAADVTLRGDTVEVLAVGPSVLAWRQIDRYALRDGRYLGSVRLAEPVGAIAAAPGGWFAIVQGQRGTAIGRVGFR